MEYLLTKVTQQAMNYAIRSGIAITSGYAFDKCSRLLKETHDSREKDEVELLQRRLESKIRIISPAIDMIELISARGNSSLESAVALTKSLRWDIQSLAATLSNAATHGASSTIQSSKVKSKTQHEDYLRLIISDMQSLLSKIEDAVPLINLAITTSGVNLSSNLPVSVSPSRLLQASAFLSTGDAEYHGNPGQPVQIGPTFTLSLYMLFSGYSSQAQADGAFHGAVWKEVIHKARLKIIRTSLLQLDSFPVCRNRVDRHIDSTIMLAEESADEFAYQIIIVEDLDDGRFHTDESGSSFKAEAMDDIAKAGIWEVIPIHEVSKLFYADTGKVLNLGTDDDLNHPVLLLKRDLDAYPPRRMVEAEFGAARCDGEVAQDTSHTSVNSSLKTDEHGLDSNRNTSRLPAGLDPEWIAFEVYTEEKESDTDSETEVGELVESSFANQHPCRSETESELTFELCDLNLKPQSPTSSAHKLEAIRMPKHPCQNHQELSHSRIGTPVKVHTSLALLEMLIRLTSLQQFQQATHLTINDELLNFFLEDSSTTGAAVGDADASKRIRMEARQRLGFDPYDESPIKRRGEHPQSRVRSSSPGSGSDQGKTERSLSSPSTPTVSLNLSPETNLSSPKPEDAPQNSNAL